MKIVIANQHIQRALGGSEIQCDIIARKLHAKGQDVIYLALESQTINQNETDYNVIPFPYSLQKFYRFLNEEKPDIIYWRNRHFRTSALLVAKFLKIPFIFAVSSHDDVKLFWCRINGSQSSLKSLLPRLRQYFKSFYNYPGLIFADGVTTLNSDFLNKIPVKNKKTIWNAMDYVSTPFVWKRPYFVWVATIKQIKQPEIYMNLAKELNAQYPHIDFIMVGPLKSDDYRDLIQKAAEDIKTFHYIGQKTPQEVSGLLESAIGLIHTCLPEGFGNNFIQAWHAGCPTVTYQFDPEGLIEKYGLGFNANGDFNRLVETTSQLIDNKHLRETMAARAQKFALENFTCDRLINEVEDFLITTVKIKNNAV